MKTFVIRQVFLLAGLAFLVGADTSVEEFEALREDVFGKAYELSSGSVLEEKVHRMIRLVEGGEIPAEVQGNQTLEYLKSLSDDCDWGDCNLDQDVQKLERLAKRDTAAPNLRVYLSFCRRIIMDSCDTYSHQQDIYERASSKLGPVDEQSMLAVDALAKQVDKELGTGVVNHATVLRALKALDPKGSKVMLKKWRKRRAALAEFMDKIRLPCIEFLDHIEPVVKLTEPVYYSSAVGHWKANNWHLCLNCCEQIIDNWISILENAYPSYRYHLADENSKKTGCCFFEPDDGGLDEGGWSVRNSTLIWSATR